MLSAKVPKTSIPTMEVNMFWDGLFHSFTWLMVAAGIAMLWRAGRNREVFWAGKTFAGALILGWGMFNFIEGLINHHLLHAHHVVERLGVSIFDFAFLLSGIVLMAGGWFAIRSDMQKGGGGSRVRLT